MKKNNLTRRRQLAAASAAALSLASAGSAHAATVLGITANDTSSTPAFGSTLAGLTNDAFSYNPDNPTATSPFAALTGLPNIAQAFHASNANGIDAVLNFDLTAHTTTTAEPTIVVDLWGRSNYSQATEVGLRDDDIDVILLNGGSTVGTVSGLLIDQGVPATGTAYVRATFDSLTVGTTFDAIQIVGHDTSFPTANFFTLAEVEAAAIAAVPEPSSTALIGLAGLAFIFRRRK